jgi:hypothetical protein
MPRKTTITILLGILAAVVVFHVSIVVGIVPYSIAWGGRIESMGQMYLFEAVSILANVVLGYVLLLKSSHLNSVVPERWLNRILWIFFGLFLLNTVGNIFAVQPLERGFAVLTLGMAVLILLVLKSEAEKTK